MGCLGMSKVNGLRGAGKRVVSIDNFTPFGIGASRHEVGPLGVMITPRGVGTSPFWDEERHQ